MKGAQLSRYFCSRATAGVVALSSPNTCTHKVDHALDQIYHGLDQMGHDRDQIYHDLDQIDHDLDHLDPNPL